MREPITHAELVELIARANDLLIHHHKGKQSCITFRGDRYPEDDRRLLTALRLLKGDMDIYRNDVQTGEPT